MIDFRLRGGRAIASRCVSPRLTASSSPQTKPMCQLSRYGSPPLSSAKTRSTKTLKSSRLMASNSSRLGMIVIGILLHIRLHEPRDEALGDSAVVFGEWRGRRCTLVIALRLGCQIEGHLGGAQVASRALV